MKKIRIAQIGVLHDHAPVIFDSLMKLEDFEVVGFAREAASAPLTGAFVGASEYEISVEKIFDMCKNGELDAVAVESNELRLTDYAIRLAELGIPMHMDKPGGIELSDFERLVDTVKEKDIPFSLGYMYRFNPNVKAALEAVKRGDIGRIHSIEAQMNCKHPPQKRQWLEQFPGGMTFFLGCHLVDLAVMFLGFPDEVLPLNYCSGTDGVTSLDDGLAILKYKNAAAIIKTSANEPSGFLRRQLVIAGDKGTIEINPIEKYIENDKDSRLNQSSSMRISCGEKAESWGYISEFSDCEPYNRYDEMMRTFARAVRGEERLPFSPDYELEVYKAVLKTCGK